MIKANRVFLIDIPIYNTDLLFVVNISDVKLKHRVKHLLKLDTEEKMSKFMTPLTTDIENTKARTVAYESGAMCVRFFNVNLFSANGLSIVSHELIHVCTFLFERIGMPHNRDTDEAYAYLHAFLVEKFFEEL
jgi:hypothetical protein